MYFCSFLIGLHVFVFAWPVCRLHSVALGIRNIKCHYDRLASIIIEQLKEVTFYLFVGFFFFISFLSAESLIIIPTDSPCFPWRSVRLTFHASQISSYDSVSPGSGWPAEARTGRSAGEPEAGALRRTHLQPSQRGDVVQLRVQIPPQPGSHSREGARRGRRQRWRGELRARRARRSPAETVPLQRKSKVI